MRSLIVSYPQGKRILMKKKNKGRVDWKDKGLKWLKNFSELMNGLRTKVYSSEISTLVL